MNHPPFEIAGTTFASGTKGHVWLDVAHAPAGGTIAVPLIVAHGAEPGPTVVIEACAHGDEYEGTLSVITFMADLMPDRLRGTVLAVPVLNGPAFEAETRGSPLERYHYDLNRTFPGSASGSLTQRITAQYFEHVVKRASTVISLHGGGNVFYLDGFVVVHGDADDEAGVLDLVRAFGWPRFTTNPDVGANPYQGTLWEKCHAHGIRTIVGELGGACRRSPTDLVRAKGMFHNAIQGTLRHLGLLAETPDPVPTLQRIKKQNLRAAHGGIIDLAPGIDIDAPVSAGSRLLTIYDPVGTELEVLSAPFDGYVMAIPGSPLAYPGRILTSVYTVVEEIPPPRG